MPEQRPPYLEGETDNGQQLVRIEEREGHN
jgi:hypothetical protein